MNEDHKLQLRGALQTHTAGRVSGHGDWVGEGLGGRHNGTGTGWPIQQPEEKRRQ